MRADTLDILRCPYCGGRLALATAQFHTLDGDDLVDGILGCHCCAFPVVAGIPVLHLQPAASKALGHLDAGRADLALLSVFELEEDPASAERFTALAGSATSTYRDIADALGSTFEGGYFLYRFSDPTFVVAEAVVQSVAAAVLREGGRAVDVCGGSGHLTRTLVGMSSPAPVLADLYFSKTWLARRFTAPGCEAVACDGNSPLPFARGAFRYAMCSDAFMYIWTKRQFVQEMLRLTDTGDTRTAVVINHTHNQLTWSPSHGQALPPSGYRDLFETIEPKLFAEANLLADIVGGGPLDLSRRDDQRTLDEDPALTLVASRDPRVFARHPLAPAREARGEFRINPLYRAKAEDGRIRLQLHFPSEDYEQEYGACRRYLESDLVVDSDTLGLLPAPSATGRLADLARRRAILDLPKRYY
ncbi:MAG TPA: hypothetical protein VGJ29_02495 [Vicinamibacterales bacterium]